MAYSFSPASLPTLRLGSGADFPGKTFSRCANFIWHGRFARHCLANLTGDSGKSADTVCTIGRRFGKNADTVCEIRDSVAEIAGGCFPSFLSHYVRLLSVRTDEARRFYETEALRGGWSLRQLDRQIGSQFYERTALSKNKAAMLTKGAAPKPEDAVTAEAEIKDPFVLEFLGLKDEYSERDLEEALIQHLESFLLELGPDFTFVARQKRLRVGDTWYRIDLLLYPSPPALPGDY